MNLRPRHHNSSSRKPGGGGRGLVTALALAAALWLAGCAAQPIPPGTNTGGSGAQQLAQQLSTSQTVNGVRVTFHYSDYYGLFNPNTESCAGDARNFYDPIALIAPTGTTASLGYDAITGVQNLYVPAGAYGPTGPMPLPLDATNSDQTIRPSFIKNVSVDMTDANSTNSLNRAVACSLGNGGTVPATSSCATFDFGAVGGVPSTLGGTMLIIGGVQSLNYSGYLPASQQVAFPYQGTSLACGTVRNLAAVSGTNGASAPTGYTNCYSGIYALGVDTLPSSVFTTDPALIPAFPQNGEGPTGPVSMWADLSGSAGFTGPSTGAGAAISYDPGLQQVLVFGGVAPLVNLGSEAPGVTTYDTWLFDLKSQQWSYLAANVYVAPAISILYDMLYDIEAPGAATTSNFAPTPQQIPKSSGPRSLFGYVSAPGMGTIANGPNSAFMGGSSMSPSMVDPTDRLMVISGYAGTTYYGTHRLNPTYGPELQNALTDTSHHGHAPQTAQSDYGIPGLVTPYPVFWADSYHTQLVTNSLGSQFKPANTPGTTGNAVPYTNFSTWFAPDLPPISWGPTGGQQVINSSFTALSLNNGATWGVQGTGYILGAGGFDATLAANLPDTTNGDDVTLAVCTGDATATVKQGAAEAPPTGSVWNSNTDLRCGGGMSLLTRYYTDGGGANADWNETTVADWDMAANYIDNQYTPLAPGVWTHIRENTDGSWGKKNDFVDLLGGQSMLQGFNINQNEVVLFGGLDCRSYVSDPTAPCRVNLAGASALQTSSGYEPPPIGRYFQIGQTPAGGLHPQPTGAYSAGWSNAGMPPDNADHTSTWAVNPANPSQGTLPYAAGMAVARGLDPAGNVIMLAWGGAVAGARTEGYNKIYYLTSTDITNPKISKWGIATPSATTVVGQPAELINAAMVFSHVTHKFYVFGGYDPSVQATRGSTYELSLVPINPANSTCVLGSGTNDCRFVWRQLDQTTGIGLTCYPSGCPQARRSHRMVEVNYYNRNPGGTNNNWTAAFNNQQQSGGTHLFYETGESQCTPTAPCSYGIFMEGGTPDGVNYLSDRWMFDPTANGGNGHWQLMTDFPPRALSAMSPVDYALPTNGQVLHRALLFGGETGLHNAEWAPTGSYFVAPTLGDSWIFDFDNKTWNRVQLVGQGYAAKGSTSAIPGLTGGGDAQGTEFAHRQAFDAEPPSGAFGDYPGYSGSCAANNGYCLGNSYQELSPPPISGAVMVTRTSKLPIGTVPATPTSLALPEVYLFGGRLKDGSFNSISNVYKFCMGTSGEAFTFDPAGTMLTTSVPNPQDFTCDAFDPVNNPGSPSPMSTYIGRWLTKNPDVATTSGTTLAKSSNDPTKQANIASYMGAGAYDSTRDRIVLFGGLTSVAPLTSTAVTDTSNLVANASIYEYTPPQPQLASVQPTATVVPREGRWTFVPSCAGYPAPVGRYGHSMSYDSRDQEIIVVGGYAAGGTPLTEQIMDQSVGSTYSTPEVWAGRYCATATCPGVPSSVELTNTPCYYWHEITTFGNSTAIQAQLPPETGLAHAAATFIPATGYNLGYYAMFDDACQNEGPIASPDPSLNKLMAGGAYIDIDRTQLGPNENLLLNISYMPLGPGNINPDNSPMTQPEAAVFLIHLIKTGQTQQQLEGAFQPRYMTYSDTTQYPETVQKLSILAPPTGQMVQEQVLLPISVDPGIDRIRIERYSGTGILIDAAVYRMGSK